MHALALEHPGRQRRVGHRAAGAMSARIISATACQPAACQVSNGPCAQPKPQRIARSMSRALSAMSPRCTAQ
jgi:hypothetical protein